MALVIVGTWHPVIVVFPEARQILARAGLGILESHQPIRSEQRLDFSAFGAVILHSKLIPHQIEDTSRYGSHCYHHVRVFVSWFCVMTSEPLGQLDHTRVCVAA